MTRKNEIKMIVLVMFLTILISGILTLIIVHSYTDRHCSENFSRLNAKIEEKEKTICKHDSIIDAINAFFSEDFIFDNAIRVGINTSLHGNEVSIYNDKKINFLKEGERIIIQNHRHNYKPSAQLLVIDIKERSTDTIQANIFISTEVARMLGIDEKQQKKIGVFNMKLMKIVN